MRNTFRTEHQMHLCEMAYAAGFTSTHGRRRKRNETARRSFLHLRRGFERPVALAGTLSPDDASNGWGTYPDFVMRSIDERNGRVRREPRRINSSFEDKIMRDVLPTTEPQTVANSGNSTKNSSSQPLPTSSTMHSITHCNRRVNTCSGLVSRRRTRRMTIGRR